MNRDFDGRCERQTINLFTSKGDVRMILIRKLSMTRFRLLIVAMLAFVFPQLVVLGVDDEEAPEEKPVRRSWFPRFSPDSQWLLTAHGDWDQNRGGEVRVWNVKTGKERFTIRQDRGVRSVCWSHNGKFFASGGYGNLVRLYDAETGKATGEFKFSGSVEELLLSPDDKRLITFHGGGSVRVTELSSKKRIRDWNQVHNGGIWGAALSHDGKIIATAGRDGFARVLAIDTGLVLYELKHPQSTNGLAFTRTGRYLVTGCQDSIIRVFDMADGTEIRQLKGHEQGSITDIQFSSDEKIMATSGMDRTIRIWDMEDFEHPLLKTTLDAHADLAFGVAISPDGEYLASAGWDDRVNVWKISTNDEVWSWTR